MSVLTRSLLIGLGGWAAATLLFRLVGEYLFPNDVIVLAFAFLIAPLTLFFLGKPIFAWTGASPNKFPISAAGVVLPGMMLDSFLVPNLALVLPNLERSLDGSFGGFLLLCYASILAAGVVFSGKSESPS